jgi:hypothetical protein
VRRIATSVGRVQKKYTAVGEKGEGVKKRRAAGSEIAAREVGEGRNCSR